MSRYWLIAAVCAVAAICLIETAEGKKNPPIGKGGNPCAQRCVRDCRSRRRVHGYLARLKSCTASCLKFAQTCYYCSNVIAGCSTCATGYTLLYRSQCVRASAPPFELWAAGVDSVSSSANDSASQVVGEPDVYPMYGDMEGAWAPLKVDSRDFIVVYFAESVYATGVDIYETFNAGGTVGVSLFDEIKNVWSPLWWTSTPTFMDQSRIFSVASSAILTRRVRVTVDSRWTGSRVEIDAIKLKGYKR